MTQKKILNMFPNGKEMYDKGRIIELQWQGRHWVCSRFLLEFLGKSPSCSKHPTQVTWADNAVFSKTPQGAQISPNLPEVFAQGDRVEWVTWLSYREIDQLLVCHFRTRNVVQNMFSSGFYAWRHSFGELVIGEISWTCPLSGSSSVTILFI